MHNLYLENISSTCATPGGGSRGPFGNEFLTKHNWGRVEDVFSTGWSPFWLGDYALCRPKNEWPWERRAENVEVKRYCEQVIFQQPLKISHRVGGSLPSPGNRHFRSSLKGKCWDTNINLQVFRTNNVVRYFTLTYFPWNVTSQQKQKLLTAVQDTSPLFKPCFLTSSATVNNNNNNNNTNCSSVFFPERFNVTPCLLVCQCGDETKVQTVKNNNVDTHHRQLCLIIMSAT